MKARAEAPANYAMKSQPILKTFWSVIWLATTTVLVLATVFATEAMAQQNEEYSVIRISALGYFDPVDVDEPVDVTDSVVSLVKDKPSANSELPESKLSLDMTLKTPNPITCKGSSFWLEVEIKNTGKKPVKIGKHEVWAYFVYDYGMGSDDERDGEIYFGGRSPDFFVLAVGESYRDTHEFFLKAYGFNENLGKYALRMKIETVESNDVTFEICDCGNTQEEAN